MKSMNMPWYSRRGVGLAVVMLVIPALLVAAPRKKRGSVRKHGTVRSRVNFEAAPVELFSAMKEGLVSAKVIPLSERGFHVLLENKSDQPLNVQVPSAVVAFSPPILKQQGMGGGMGGGGMGGGGMGGGMGTDALRGGFMNVPLAAHGTRQRIGKRYIKDKQKLSLGAVCLEHGRANPRPSMKKRYRLISVEQYTTNPVAQELIRQFATGRVARPVAQAAIWHAWSGLSWRELATKRVGRAVGPGELYFHPQVIRRASTLVYFVSSLIEDRQEENEKSRSRSLASDY